MLPIIDTHQHLWDLSKFQTSWMTPGHPLEQSFTPKEYAEAIAGLNVVKSVYMEVDVRVDLQQAEVDYIVGLCKSGKTPMVAAVVSGRPAEPNFKRYIAQFQDSRYVKGVREVIHEARTPPGYCLRPEFIRGVQLLGQIGLSFDICIRAGELADAGKLVDNCPDTRFILDHCGNEPVPKTDHTQWKRDMEALAKRKNLVCKVSGIVASAKKGAWKPADLAPIVNHTLNVFGPDRVMFGGDWPVCTLAATFREWVTALKEIVKDRSEEQQRKLFHDNAARFYGI
jgi:predicted TIM-barrel fold metal-dependent hydrolase